MKKIIYFPFLAFIFLAFSSCEKKADSIILDNIFSVDCTYISEDFDCGFSLIRLGNGGWEISFTSPETLDGLKVSYFEDKINLSFLGLETQIDKNFISPIFAKTTSAFDAFIASSELNFIKNENEILTELLCGNENYIFVFDKTSKEILKIYDEKETFLCEFKDYKKV